MGIEPTTFGCQTPYPISHIKIRSTGRLSGARIWYRTIESLEVLRFFKNIFLVITEKLEGLEGKNVLRTDINLGILFDLSYRSAF